MKTALITGAARRIGARIARHLHQQGWRVVLHYRHSRAEAEALAAELNTTRAGSAAVVQGDLLDIAHLPALAAQAIACFGRIDALINNASTFYATPVGEISEQNWQALIGSNLQAPLFLAQALTPELTRNSGAIVNLADIHAERPMAGHVVYSIAKAGVVAMTKSLARELAPAVRVNAVAPGANLWPEVEDSIDLLERERILSTIPLQKNGSPDDIAGAVGFLLNAPYLTGVILPVDGGRSVHL